MSDDQTSPLQEVDDKETVLSPNAPVFFPKWKRNGSNLNSPTNPRKQFGAEDDDSATPHAFTPTFSNDFGRSLSGGFNPSATSQFRATGSAFIPNASLPNTSPNANANPAPAGTRRLGRSTVSGFTSAMPSTIVSSPLGLASASSSSRPGIGPGMLGPRSASWREDATPSWRGETPNVLMTSHSASQQQMMSAAAAAVDESKGSSKAITVEHRMIKPGSYSTWIRVLSADIGPAQLASVLNRCEESNNKGVIHVYLREKFINRQLVQQLKSQNYKFHHFVEDTQTFVYGKQAEGELSNATAKEGVGALVISPDELHVLLVWEAGKWSFLAGNTVTRESVIDAAKREIRTQLSLELDKTFTARIVGGWTKAAAKFDCINEVFLCFVLKSATTTLNLGEDTHARWFAIDDLMQLLDLVDAQFKQQGTEPKLDAAIEHPPGHVFSQTTLRWLRAFKAGSSWNTCVVAERNVFCCV
eukprot:c11875_g1_i1.p1 GENE.c11875_g1_i1~~c11875_g1_i1.p1  ORF type:complete len:472 (-),score=142.94 c11875_g1_i1:455-1870(-)